MKLFYGGGDGGLSKNVSHRGWLTKKNSKKLWLKHPKAVPNDFLKTARCVSLIKCFTIFHFN